MSEETSTALTKKQRRAEEKRRKERENLVDQCIDMLTSMNKTEETYKKWLCGVYASILLVPTAIVPFLGAGSIWEGFGAGVALCITYLVLSIRNIGSDKVGTKLLGGAPFQQVDSGYCHAPFLLCSLAVHRKGINQLHFGSRDEADGEEDCESGTYHLEQDTFQVQFGSYENDKGQKGESEARAQAQAASPHLVARYIIVPNPIKELELEKLFAERSNGTELAPCGHAIFLSVIGSIREANESIRETAIGVLLEEAGKCSLEYAIRNSEKIRKKIATAIEQQIGERTNDESRDEVQRFWGIDFKEIQFTRWGVSDAVTNALSAAAEAKARKKKTITDAEAEKQKRQLEGEGLKNPEAMISFKGKVVQESMRGATNHMYGSNPLSAVEAVLANVLKSDTPDTPPAPEPEEDAEEETPAEV